MSKNFSFVNPQLMGVKSIKDVQQRMLKLIERDLQRNGHLSPTAGVTMPSRSEPRAEITVEELPPPSSVKRTSDRAEITVEELPPPSVDKPISVERLTAPNYQSTIEAMHSEAQMQNPNTFDKQYEAKRYEALKESEGVRLESYKDTNGLTTVGIGFNMEDSTARATWEKAMRGTNMVDKFDDVKSGTTKISQENARALFDVSVRNAEQEVDSAFDVPLNSYQRIALVSLAYNNPALLGPNLRAAINNGDFLTALDEILNRSNKNKHKGIQNRREREAKLFSGGAHTTNELYAMLDPDTTRVA